MKRLRLGIGIIREGRGSDRKIVMNRGLCRERAVIERCEGCQNRESFHSVH